MPINAQWIRRRRKEGRRGRRRRARDDNARACVLLREFVDRETDTFPPLGSRRKSYARSVHVIETKGHAASIHIDEHAKHYRIRAPRPTAVTERSNLQIAIQVHYVATFQHTFVVRFAQRKSKVTLSHSGAYMYCVPGDRHTSEALRAVPRRARVAFCRVSGQLSH